MKFYIGKWYAAIRIGDACLGFGNLPQSLLAQADRTRPHLGI